MLRSMFSSISGLRAHQTMMDVTGNNIANVNTTGYKSAQALFQDTLSQTLLAAGAGDGENAGTNPAQVGLGVKTAGIATSFVQGAAQSTGRSTDLMINGDGFFVVSKAGQQLYTRAGAFTFDAQGNLTTQDGAFVQGWMAAGAALDTTGPVQNITLPIGILNNPTATTDATVAGNLPADSPITPAAGSTFSSSIDIYDALGAESTLSLTAVHTATGWDVTLTDGTTTVGPTAITFDAAGALATPAAGTLAFGGITVDISTITQFAGASTMAITEQTGAPVGTLVGFSLTNDGSLVGQFSNGNRQVIGQVALAAFNNPQGLEKVGNSTYRDSVNSGVPLIGTPGAAGRGNLQGGSLEMSNVDLAQEFTNLIISQRGFQANSRVITASDEILQDLVNMKR